MTLIFNVIEGQEETFRQACCSIAEGCSRHGWLPRQFFWHPIKANALQPESGLPMLDFPAHTLKTSLREVPRNAQYFTML